MSELSGKVGHIIYRQTQWGTVAYVPKKRAGVPRRSEAQMRLRTQWANLNALYRQFNRTLRKGFEGVKGMSDYNAFVQANVNVVKVYISKKVRLNGGSVLAPYMITRGTFPSIAVEANANQVLVSDIALGNLVIDANTTVAQFSAAVIGHNQHWVNGDQLTFFYGEQTVDAVTSIPRASIQGFKVVLDLADISPLMSRVTALGFSSIATQAGNYLGMSHPIADGGAAWIHSRDVEGDVKVSTQYLLVDNSLLAQYQTDGAFGASADSYGGINTSAVYLQPTAVQDADSESDLYNQNGENGQNGQGSQSGQNGQGGENGQNGQTPNPDPNDGGDDTD